MQVKGCCPLDCQDSCAWVAHVEGDRVVRIEGAKEHPITRGVLCAKVRDYESRVTAPDRLHCVPLSWSTFRSRRTHEGGDPVFYKRAKGSVRGRYERTK